jgi:WD40 repeat protein/serine/threonine protein kinase
MPTWDPQANDLFLKALELQSPGERQAYLDGACGGDSARRAEVESLLEASARAGSFLESPARAVSVTEDLSDDSEGPHMAIGPYKLLEQIGEGGFGVVFMAEQTHPVRRKVALKIIKPGMDKKQVVARFEAERQALALMDHPNIAKVHEAGATALGRPYFVMELVKGIPITQFCDEKRLTPRERLELFIPVCQAIQHAHQKGIIHRDLKPSNVLVGLYDNEPVPKVIDFGVAKAAGPKLTEATLFTGFGTVIGTPEYMSPEQAQLDNLDIDTRSDIYSLGVLLYELLTGSPPFTKKELEKAGLLETLRVIREQEPKKPSTMLSTAAGLPTLAANRGTEPAKLTKLMRGELDWIVMTALDKDRNRRYQTANALVMDLERYLADEPVLACPPSKGYRFRKFARRNKAALVTASAVALTVLVTVAVSTVLIWRANQNLQEALVREQRDSYFHRITLAHRELSADNLGGALKYLDECPEDLRGWEWHYLMRLGRDEPLVIRGKTEVNSLAFSANGKHLVAACGDGSIKIWDTGTRKLVRNFENTHGRYVSSVAFHPSGTRVASVGADHRVKVWDIANPTGPPVFNRPCDAIHLYGTAYAAAFSPDGSQLAAGSAGVVNLWDWSNDRILHTLPGHEKRPISVAFSRDGQRLASGDWLGAVRLWDTTTGRLVRTLTETQETHHPVSALAFGPDGKRLATASFRCRVDLWDTATGELIRSLPHSWRGLVLGVAFSRDGFRIASAGEEKMVHVWDAATGREVLTLRGHTGNCGCVAFSPDGHRLASASTDGTIRVWDATPRRRDEDQEVARTLRHHNNEVRTLAVSPDGRVVSGGDAPAKVWDPQTGLVTAEFPGHRIVVFCLAWRPDGQRIASAGVDQGLFTVEVWDPQNGQVDFTLREALPGDSEFFSVAFSPDGRFLVMGRANGKLQVWDAQTQKVRLLLGTHRRAIRGVVFSPDGLHLASASTDGEIKIWDATRLDKEQKASAIVRGRVHGPSLNLAFSPDGNRLATGGEENTVKIWDVQTGRELRSLSGHHGDIYALAFSRDGRWLASAGEDSTVRMWDCQNNYTLARTLRGHTALVSCLAFSRDGRHLYSGSRDTTVKVWDMTELDNMTNHY